MATKGQSRISVHKVNDKNGCLIKLGDTIKVSDPPFLDDTGEVVSLYPRVEYVSPVFGLQYAAPFIVEVVEKGE